MANRERRPCYATVLGYLSNWSLPEEIAFLDHLHLFLTREFGQEAGWINAQRYTWYWKYILCKMTYRNKLVDEEVTVPVGRWQQYGGVTRCEMWLGVWCVYSV